MNPELERGIRKLRLMAAIRSDPEKIHQEARKFYCNQCLANKNACPNRTSDKVAFKFGYNPLLAPRFILWKCWTPK